MEAITLMDPGIMNREFVTQTKRVKDGTPGKFIASVETVDFRDGHKFTKSAPLTEANFKMYVDHGRLERMYSALVIEHQLRQLARLALDKLYETGVVS